MLNLFSASADSPEKNSISYFQYMRTARDPETRNESPSVSRSDEFRMTIIRHFFLEKGVFHIHYNLPLLLLTREGNKGEAIKLSPKLSFLKLIV